MVGQELFFVVSSLVMEEAKSKGEGEGDERRNETWSSPCLTTRVDFGDFSHA